MKIKVNPARESDGATNTTSSHHATDNNQYKAGLRRRRAASYRVERLECTCRDPWTCRCYDDPEPTARQVDAYRDAALHLMAQGLPAAPNIAALRHLWRRGGTEQRLAQLISQRWEMAA